MLRRVASNSVYMGRQNVTSLMVKKNKATVAATESLQDEWVSAKPFEEIPGPKPLPLIGNMWRFMPLIGSIPTDIVRLQDYFYKKYGDISKLEHIPGKNNAVFLFNVEDLEKVYRNDGPWPIRPGIISMLYYRKVTRKDLFEGVGGALLTHGKEWHDFRSAVNQIMMQPRSTKLYVQPIDAVAADFIERIRIIRDEKLEMPDDFANELCKWALESIVYIALDKRLGCLANDLESDSEPQKMINAVNVMLESIFLLDMTISPWRLISTPQWRKFVKASDFFNELCIKYINEAIERLKTLNDADRELTVLEKILAKEENPKTAMVMALDMMTAGVDTTSFTTATILHFLGTHAEKQDKAFQEIESFIKDKDQPVTSEILNELKYLKACIKEAMRLQPVAVGTARTLTKDIVLSGYKVPKGTDAVMTHSYLSKMDRHFPEAEKFIPERWLKSSEHHRSQSQDTHPFVSLPFGYGPRSCLGKRFALLEIETVLAKILRNFRVEYNYGELEYQSRLLVTPVSKLKFKMIERE